MTAGHQSHAAGEKMAARSMAISLFLCIFPPPIDAENHCCFMRAWFVRLQDTPCQALCISDANFRTYKKFSCRFPGRTFRKHPFVSSHATLSYELAVNAKEHENECSSALKQWPTIAHTYCAHEPLGTTTANHVHSSSLISPDNRPFHSRALVHVTDSPLLSAADCAAIIEEAERLGLERGWRSRYTLQVRICKSDSASGKFVARCKCFQMRARRLADRRRPIDATRVVSVLYLTNILAVSVCSTVSVIPSFHV